MDPDTDTSNAPVPPEFSDGAKELPGQAQPLRRAQDVSGQNTQPQQAPQAQAQAQAPNQASPQPQVGQPNIDIEAMKREAQARRQAAQPKQPEDYRTYFSKRYILAVSILLVVSAIVFGLIIIIQLTRG